MKMLKKLFTKINKSCIEKSGRYSHTRITSYIILVVITLSSLVFLGIDITNLVTALFKGETYEIPTSHITLFGMMLSHHLVLLGLKKHSENQQCKYECENGITEKKNNNK